jgi:uncharacterized protein
MSSDSFSDSPFESKDPQHLPEPGPTEAAVFAVQPPHEPGGGSRFGAWLSSDLRVPWGWIDIALLAVIAVGCTFLFGIVLVLILAAFGVSPAQLQKSPSEWGLVAVVAQILADLTILGYLALQVRHRFDLPFWQTIGWRRIEPGKQSLGLVIAALVFGGFFMALVVSLLDAAFPSKQSLPIESLLKDHRIAILFMITAVLVAPVIEETVFRGYIYPVAARTWGMVPGILVTGTLFGLLHSVQLWGGWAQIAFLVLVGIVLTAVRAFTRTVLASYIIHASYNALPVIFYLLAVYHLHYFPTGS